MNNDLRHWLKKIFFIFLAGIIGGYWWPSKFLLAQADLGVSPAKIINLELRPGNQLEKTIFISRSDPSQELQAIIEPDLGELASWITFIPGEKFILPANESQVPFQIKITVPPQAELKKYQGQLRLKVSALKPPTDLAIVKGAKIELQLAVTDQLISQILLRQASIAPATANQPLLLSLTIENQGNESVVISSLELPITDQHQQLLTVLTATDLNFSINPFATIQHTFELPHQLPIGEYWLTGKIITASEPIDLPTMVISILDPAIVNQPTANSLISHRLNWVSWLATGIFGLLAIITSYNLIIKPHRLVNLTFLTNLFPKRKLIIGQRLPKITFLNRGYFSKLFKLFSHQMATFLTKIAKVTNQFLRRGQALITPWLIKFAKIKDKLELKLVRKKRYQNYRRHVGK